MIIYRNRGSCPVMVPRFTQFINSALTIVVLSRKTANQHAVLAARMNLPEIRLEESAAHWGALMIGVVDEFALVPHELQVVPIRPLVQRLSAGPHAHHALPCRTLSGDNGPGIFVRDVDNHAFHRLQPAHCHHRGA